MNRELMKDFLRESFPNPERKGCPEEDVLQALAEDRISSNDPALLHVGSCSECYAEYLNLRQDFEEARERDRKAPSLAQENDSSRQNDGNILPFPGRSDA